ncbi:MAG: hypothetical protein MJK12_07800 [Colwellia sp.]|nr:hypothetical protein [Colwellia sp.]
MYKLVVLFVSIVISGCITVPVTVETHSHECKLSSDMKTLQVVDVAAESNSYYSVTGILLSPILIPTTAIVSGVYVLVNNVYHLGQERFNCADVST